MFTKVLNAPSYFGTIWSFLKNWVDPETAAKLVILSPAEVLPTLTTFIDLDNIPTKFGGAFHFTPGMIPDMDLGIRRLFDWSPSSRKELPPGPIKWNLDSAGRKVAVAVGSVDGILRFEPFAVLSITPLANVQSNANIQS